MNNKVAFLTYSLSGGGAERNIILLQGYLKKARIQADIVILKDINEYSEQYPHLNDVIPLSPFKNKAAFYVWPFIAFFVLSRLLFLFKKRGYRIVIGLPHFAPYYISALLAKIFNIKCMLVVVNNITNEMQDSAWLMRHIHTNLLKASFQMSDLIICKSHGLARMVSHHFHIQKNKVIIIPNGLDLSDIRNKTKEGLLSEYESLFHNNRVIITAGRLEKQKNHTALLLLFRLLKKNKKTKDIKLCILGKGSQLSRLREEIKIMGLQNEVFLLGHEKRNIYRYFAKSTLFILPSKYEGFGNVLIEALSCGLPVVSTDCHFGPREIITGNPTYPRSKLNMVKYEKYGMLMPLLHKNPHLLKGIAYSLVKLLNNPKKLRHYKTMSLLRAKDYSLQRMGEQYERILKILA